jgi:AIPR protein
MSSNPTLEQFAENLRQDVVVTSEVEDAETFLEEAFTAVVKGYLADAGEFADAEVCVLHDGGRQVHAYNIDEEAGVLDLVIVLHRNLVPPQTVERSLVVSAFARLRKFIVTTFEGYEPAEEASPAFDMCQVIRSRKEEITRIRMYLITDGLTTRSVEDLVAEPIASVPVSLHIWDLERLFRCATSGQARETIEIDVVAENGAPLPCLAMPEDSADYRAFLCILPGRFLHRLYERYGDRLLERNVRSFLQVRGKVNRGIRDTLLGAPHRFFAYNNGISATAGAIELLEAPGGGLLIKTLRDLQIVNGGQTTASLYQAVARDKADITSVSVQAKISVVRSQEIEQIVPLISRYANSQNKISEPDFSANDYFHVALEELSRTIWTPPVEGSQRLTRWFYERARGQYQVAKAREGTPARQKAFGTVHPPQQKFTKTELAKFENSWQQRPHLVSRGGEKNFREFTIQLKDKALAPDEAFFHRLVAQAILFKRAEKVVQELALGGYRANVVTYSIALLAKLTDSNLNLESVWKAQDITPPLAKLLGVLARKVHEVITHPPGNANITEWCKKEQCWNTVKSIKCDIPSGILAAPTDRKSKRRSGAMKPDENDQEPLMSSVWGALAAWAEATQQFAARDRHILTAIATLAQLGRKPAKADLESGLRLLARAKELGFDDAGITGEAR